jgi:hypothetical protein
MKKMMMMEMTMEMKMRKMRTLTPLRIDLVVFFSLFGVLMTKGEKSYLHVFPFGFELVSIWIWSGHKLLSFACLCPIVEL